MEAPKRAKPNTKLHARVQEPRRGEIKVTRNAAEGGEGPEPPQGTATERSTAARPASFSSLQTTYADREIKTFFIGRTFNYLNNQQSKNLHGPVNKKFKQIPLRWISQLWKNIRGIKEANRRIKAIKSFVFAALLLHSLSSFQFNARGEATICLVSLKNNLSMLFNRDAWHRGSGVQMSPAEWYPRTEPLKSLLGRNGEGERERSKKKKNCFLIFKNSLQNLIKAEQKLTFLPLWHFY